MTEYISQDYYNGIEKQKRKLLIIYFVIAGIYAVASGLILWKYCLLPYQSPDITWIKIVEYVISGLFVIFSFVYLLIPYKRVKDFHRALLYNKYGESETSEGRFFEYSEELQVKDGVDMKALIFIEWNDYDKDYHERKVMVYHELPFPEIPEGAYLKYRTQANILIDYEIIEEKENKDESDSNGNR